MSPVRVPACLRLATSFLVLILLLASSPASCSGRVTRQAAEDNLIDMENEFEGGSFINVSDLKNLDLSQLLEINFINKSVTHYHDKLHEVRSSLQSRVKSIIAGVRGGSQTNFSPELKQKLNESFFKLVESLVLSPNCLFSLNHLRMEIAEKRLWPLKCKYWFVFNAYFARSQSM